MPYFCATVIILSKSGSTGGGGFEGSSIFSQASSMYFSITPPGDCAISIRACASPTFLKACGVPRGAKKDSPAPHVRSRSQPTAVHSLQDEERLIIAVINVRRYPTLGSVPDFAKREGVVVVCAHHLEEKQVAPGSERRPLAGLDMFGP